VSENCPIRVLTKRAHCLVEVHVTRMEEWERTGGSGSLGAILSHVAVLFHAPIDGFTEAIHELLAFAPLTM
jgi:hypothetical protein